MNWRDQLQYQYNMAGVVERLIAINAVAFVLMYILIAIFALFNMQAGFLYDWLFFPKDIFEFLYKPWTIVTYAFLHNGIWHILWNMVLLYFSGRLFLTFFSGQRLVTYYFLGAFSGALLFMLSYNLFPAFQGVGRSSLVGASAAVMAILVGVATQASNMKVRLLFFNVKLWWIAAFFVVSDIVQMPIENPGGHLAHIGGALLGYLYTSQLAKGNNIGGWFERLSTWVVGLFQSRKTQPFKTVYRNKKRDSRKTKSAGDALSKDEKQKKVDAILDKISKSGYESLSKAEKDFLFNAGKE